jgi:uncharacterized DUF497 family protein
MDLWLFQTLSTCHEGYVFDVCQSLTYIIIPQVEREFEWARTKSDRNHLQRGFPFDLAVMLFDRPTLEKSDTRLDYQEVRMQAIGMNGTVTLACVSTDRAFVRRIISLRPANKRA